MLTMPETPIPSPWPSVIESLFSLGSYQDRRGFFDAASIWRSYVEDSSPLLRSRCA